MAWQSHSQEHICRPSHIVTAKKNVQAPGEQSTRLETTARSEETAREPANSEFNDGFLSTCN